MLKVTDPETVDVSASPAVVVVVACPTRKEAMARKKRAKKRAIANCRVYSA